MTESHHVEETDTDTTEQPKRQRRLNATKKKRNSKSVERQTPRRRVVTTISRLRRPLAPEMQRQLDRNLIVKQDG